MDIKRSETFSPDSLNFEANDIFEWYNKELKPVSTKIDDCKTLIDKTKGR